MLTCLIVTWPRPEDSRPARHQVGGRVARSADRPRPRAVLRASTGDRRQLGSAIEFASITDRKAARSQGGLRPAQAAGDAT
jgi:hypothetical protein